MGTVGALNLITTSLTGLQEAMSYATSSNRVTDASARLLNTARIVLSMRQCLMQSPPDWAAIKRVVGEARAAAQDGAFDAAALPEVELVEGECHNRTILATLRAALTGPGAVSGVAGRVEVADVSTAQLEAAIAAVRGYSCRTVMAWRLLFSAVLVLRLREGALADDWTRVKALLDDPSVVRAEIAAWGDVRSGGPSGLVVTAAGGGGGLSRDGPSVPPVTPFGGPVAGGSAAAVAATPQGPPPSSTSNFASFWNGSGVTSDVPLAPEARDEVQVRTQTRCQTLPRPIVPKIIVLSLVADELLWVHAFRAADSRRG